MSITLKENYVTYAKMKNQLYAYHVHNISLNKRILNKTIAI